MEKQNDPEFWRYFAFQIEYPYHPQKDPGPHPDMVELTRRFFTTPQQAFVALTLYDDRWQAFEKAADKLLETLRNDDFGGVPWLHERSAKEVLCEWTKGWKEERGEWPDNIGPDPSNPDKWRHDVFHLCIPSPFLGWEIGALPYEPLAELSKQFFDTPFELHTAIRNRTDQCQAFEEAAKPLLKSKREDDTVQAYIEGEYLEFALQLYVERAQDRMMQDIKTRVERIRDEPDRYRGR